MSPRGRVTCYPDEAAAPVQTAYPTFARHSYLILGCTNRDNSPFDLSKMTLGKTVNSTFWVLLLFVRRAGQPAQPASLPASQPASLPARLPKLSLPCRAKRGNPHSNAYPNSCVQIKEAWHCCFGAGRAGPHRQWDNKVRLQPSALQTNGVLPAPLRVTVCPWENF